MSKFSVNDKVRIVNYGGNIADLNGMVGYITGLETASGFYQVAFDKPASTAFFTEYELELVEKVNNTLEKAKAILAVEEARKNLVDKIQFARGHGANDSELMEILDMSSAGLGRFRAE